MMRANRSGFTLVELLIVTVLGAVVLGAAVQSLVMQERTQRTTAEIIRGQDALRTALGILEGELREVTSSGGDALVVGGISVVTVGMGDLVVATRDSIVVNATRTLGFVCVVHASDRRIVTWSLGGLDRFRVGEGVLVYADNNPNTGNDDHWLVARVTNTQASTAACPSRPGTDPIADQRVDLGTADGGPDVTGGYLATVLPGAPVRAFERVTYGLYAFDEQWGLGLRRGTGPVRPIVLGLAGPGSGLVFTYIDGDGDPIIADPIPVGSVAGVRITARTQPRAESGASPIDLETNVHFRNN